MATKKNAAKKKTTAAKPAKKASKKVAVIKVPKTAAAIKAPKPVTGLDALTITVRALFTEVERIGKTVTNIEALLEEIKLVNKENGPSSAAISEALFGDMTKDFTKPVHIEDTGIGIGDIAAVTATTSSVKTESNANIVVEFERLSNLSRSQSGPFTDRDFGFSVTVNAAGRLVANLLGSNVPYALEFTADTADGLVEVITEGLRFHIRELEDANRGFRVISANVGIPDAVHFANFVGDEGTVIVMVDGNTPGLKVWSGDGMRRGPDGNIVPIDSSENTPDTISEGQLSVQGGDVMTDGEGEPVAIVEPAAGTESMAVPEGIAPEPEAGDTVEATAEVAPAANGEVTELVPDEEGDLPF